MLFACSRCFSRHPFEELSQGDQLCRDCRGNFPVVKCTYCRSEFQQTSKGSTAAICKKCEQMVRSHGKPKACEYCNVIAAFIGSKCQRCANSEKRYGSPLTCQQCKQRCAFDRNDPDDKKKVDGKLLCWLCTLSYKRALAKTKSTDPARHTHVKLAGKTHEKRKSKYYVAKRPVRPDVTKQPVDEPEVKKARKDEHSDHMVAMAQLREEIASLNRQLQLKQVQLINKDKEICELKAKNHGDEQDLRRRMNEMQRLHEQRVDSFQLKVRQMARELAALNKKSARAGSGAASSVTVAQQWADSGSNSPATTQ